MVHHTGTLELSYRKKFAGKYVHRLIGGGVGLPFAPGGSQVFAQGPGLTSTVTGNYRSAVALRTDTHCSRGSALWDPQRRAASVHSLSE